MRGELPKAEGGAASARHVISHVGRLLYRPPLRRKATSPPARGGERRAQSCRSPFPSPPLAGGDAVGRGGDGLSATRHICRWVVAPPTPLSVAKRHLPPQGGERRERAELPIAIPTPTPSRGERRERAKLPIPIPTPTPLRGELPIPIPHSPPLAGGDAVGRGGGGLSATRHIYRWVVALPPPLCRKATSPPARGGDGERAKRYLPPPGGRGGRGKATSPRKEGRAEPPEHNKRGGAFRPRPFVWTGLSDLPRTTPGCGLGAGRDRRLLRRSVRSAGRSGRLRHRCRLRVHRYPYPGIRCLPWFRRP